MTKWQKKTAVLLTAAFLLCGCRGVTKEALEARDTGIALLEQNDYEGAIRQFESIIEQTGRVTEFELDVLKYRAEAEFGLGDYAAAAYTYDILSQVDKRTPEYSYFCSLSLARAGDTEGARTRLEEGITLDKDLEAAGYTEAMMALGEALEASGDAEGAEEIYQELILQGKAGTETVNRLMLAAMEQGNYEEALSFSELARNLSDDHSIREIRFNEAVCYEYLGQYETALALFQNYVSEFGSDERAEHEIAFLATR